ncbi:hypothetical protein T09_3536 [Trichinella sp. T9]|nr:hypothetical protein T09_3536 [Trichinella sp. T9]
MNCSPFEELRSTSVALGLNSTAEQKKAGHPSDKQHGDGFALDILCCIGFIDKLPQFKSKVHQPEDSTGGMSPIKSLLRLQWQPNSYRCSKQINGKQSFEQGFQNAQ